MTRSKKSDPAKSHVDFGIGSGSHSKIHDIQKSQGPDSWALNFHIGNCGDQIEIFALNIERTEGTNTLKLMEWNLTWLNPITSS